MSFAEKTWDERFETMGDIAEQAFELNWQHPYSRFGLNRPDLNVGALPAKVRYTPDYMTTLEGTKGVLVEVQGAGKDGVFKFKDEKLNALAEWDLDCPTTLWLWDDINSDGYWISLPQIRLAVYRKTGTTSGMFDGRKPWTGVSVDLVRELHDPEQLMSRLMAVQRTSRRGR